MTETPGDAFPHYRRRLLAGAGQDPEELSRLLDSLPDALPPEPEPADEAFGVKGGDALWSLILEAFRRAAR